MTAPAEFETRITQLTVVPKGLPIFDAMATVVEIRDEAAGEFIAISQSVGEATTVQVTSDDWPSIRAAIERLMAECRPNP